ncbi:integrase core domain-containing protein [Cellulomonas hominis]
MGELQAQLDTFRGVYNTQRPHRSVGRITPCQRRPKIDPLASGEN